MIDELIDAANADDLDRVAQLLNKKRTQSVVERVKLISSLQAQLAEKQNERDELRRKLDHLRTPVENAVKEYASALQQLEKCQLTVHELQAQQYFCDNGLRILRDDTKELEEQIIELTAMLEG